MNLFRPVSLLVIAMVVLVHADIISFEETFSRPLPTEPELNMVVTELLQLPSFSVENAELNSVTISFNMDWEVSHFNGTATWILGEGVPTTFPFQIKAKQLSANDVLFSEAVFSSAVTTLLEWNFEGNYGYSVTLDNTLIRCRSRCIKIICLFPSLRESLMLLPMIS